jgi:glycosyltransferase involved in cell wall biosynthesis
MKIALFYGPHKRVFRGTTASRPRVVYDLATSLAARGHEVTTFAPATSEVPGKLISVSELALEETGGVASPDYHIQSNVVFSLQKLIRHSGDFDIIHNHIYPEFYALLIEDRLKSPMLTTIHTEITPEIDESFGFFKESSFCALSQSQKTDGPHIPFVDIVYNGIALEDFPFNAHPDDSFLFFGRIAQYKTIDGQGIDPKGTTGAIEAAQKAAARLTIAGNVHDLDYFEQEIRPKLSEKITFRGPISKIGPIGLEEKAELYRSAKALLFPINWKEAFGLVMVEAMACGTPVIAFDRGSVREVVEDGITGFIVPPGDTDAMAEAMAKIDQIDRASCRRHVEGKFTKEHMAAGYEKVYKRLIERHNAREE